MSTSIPSQFPFADIPSLEQFTVLKIELWLLVLIRISLLVFLMPIIVTHDVPARFKAGLSFFLSILLFPLIPASAIDIPSNMPSFMLMALREIYIGAVMGFASTFVISGLRFAGSWIDSETGLNTMQIPNPMADEEDTPLGHLIFILFILVLLATGGYGFYFRAIVESFELIPLTEANTASGTMLTIFARMSSEAFLLGMKIAAPVVATLFISSIGLAMIARIVPQMNVWMVGMPMKIAVGLVTTVFALPLMLQAFLKGQDNIHEYWIALMHVMGT